MLPHYFVKVRSSSFGISGRKCSWKRNILWCLNTHPILIHLTDVLTYLFSQFPVPLKYFFCKWQTILSKQVLWTEAAFSACLAWHWQCNWRVTRTSSRVYAGKRRTLRATIVTTFSHMTRDVSVFVKCDTTFRLFFFKLPQFHTSNFRKLAWQHTEGMVRSVEFCWKFTWLSSSERILKIR